MSDRGNETVTRYAGAGIRDNFGDYPNLGTGVPVTGCAVYPRGTTEESGAASTVIVGYTVQAPGGSVFAAGDRVGWRGDIFDIEGKPGLWMFLDGEEASVQFAIKEATG